MEHKINGEWKEGVQGSEREGNDKEKKGTRPKI
jgi:hypothetical protein